MLMAQSNLAVARLRRTLLNLIDGELKMPNRMFKPVLVLSTLALPMQASAATFIDDFSSGLNPGYWSVTQTTPGLYGVNGGGGQVSLARSAHSPTGGLQWVGVHLNLAALGGNIAGDFSMQIDFNNAVLGSHSVDQVQLNAFFADGSYFLDVHDNSLGVNNHVWFDVTPPYTGGVSVIHPNPSNSGTFKIARTGAVVSGWHNSTLLFSANGYTAALSEIMFTLQNNGTNDMISSNFDNFSLTAASVPAVPEHETYAMFLAGLGLLGAAARRRKPWIAGRGE